jgi:spermidine/putrescine transport system permease protein
MKTKVDEYVLTLPSFFWLILFFFIPAAIVFAFSFKPHDIYGNVMEGWTLKTIVSLANPAYFVLIWRTLWLSTLTTLISLALAIPIGYYLALAKRKMRHLILILIVIPFWSSFLIRIFAWKSLLHPEGFLKRVLVSLSLIDEHTLLLYNSFAVLLVMVYSYLPFAILPIYAAAAKFNFQLFEAAMDLGATRFLTFYKIFIPGIWKGLLTAFIMVFVPAVGAYVIPELVGGTQSEMIGNKIAQKVFTERNLPEASALSSLLALAVLIPMAILELIQFRARKAELELEARHRE